MLGEIWSVKVIVMRFQLKIRNILDRANWGKAILAKCVKCFMWYVCVGGTIV
jgi:hypothetical protein